LYLDRGKVAVTQTSATIASLVLCPVSATAASELAAPTSWFARTSKAMTPPEKEALG